MLGRPPSPPITVQSTRYSLQGCTNIVSKAATGDVRGGDSPKYEVRVGGHDRGIDGQLVPAGGAYAGECGGWCGVGVGRRALPSGLLVLLPAIVATCRNRHFRTTCQLLNPQNSRTHEAGGNLLRLLEAAQQCGVTKCNHGNCLMFVSDSAYYHLLRIIRVRFCPLPEYWGYSMSGSAVVKESDIEVDQRAAIIRMALICNHPSSRYRRLHGTGGELR